MNHHGYLMSQMQSLWSSATLPKRDSWSKCQATSSTTAVCPVNTLLALITWWKVWSTILWRYLEWTFHLICFNSSMDVPEAECLIIACRKQVTVHVWVPGQAIPGSQLHSKVKSFLKVPSGRLSIRSLICCLTLPSCVPSSGTLAYTCHWGPAVPLSACLCQTQAPASSNYHDIAVKKYEWEGVAWGASQDKGKRSFYFACWSLGGNYWGILRHVSCPVHLE